LSLFIVTARLASTLILVSGINPFFRSHPMRYSMTVSEFGCYLEVPLAAEIA
jgi:hypothetical protein